MLTPADRERYRRQLPLIGDEGQERLREAAVLVAGAGGLGTSIALHCAYAGIGRIRIVDQDRVDLSNLNRQILYRDADLGKSKAVAAAERLRGAGPHLRVEPVEASIDAENVRELAEGVDLILDGMDNFDARYLLADAARECAVPFIHGAIHGFFGQVTTIIPETTPCLRCIVPHPPPGGAVPILGVTAGVIGCMQTAEAIKWLAGTGDLLAGRLLLWDGLRAETEVLAVEGDAACPVCGEHRRKCE
ncbi:MAG: HesA/MoeB/ThiF family protein [Methanomicrobiaceae archaeon]|nr:HesA/MoeB/ThiF family protein [Methanomicrobiaceae archaeon]